MWLLRLPLLWALLSMARGDPQNVREISTQLGSEVLLPVTIQPTLSSTDGQSCDHVTWIYVESGDKEIAVIRRCQQPEYNRDLTNMKISENGSLIISPVTAKHAGRYRVTIRNSAGIQILTDDFTFHVEDPVSVPVLDILCLSDGRAQISCRVDNGTNYTIYLNGQSKAERSSNSSNINITVPAPGPWSVSCMVKNRVSQAEINQTKEACPVSLSGIVMNHTCHTDGRAEVFCQVDKGSDPQFSWSLDGKSQKGESNSSYSRVTLPPPVSGILCCDVTNEINMLNHSMNVFCAAPLSVPVISVSCLSNGSAEISCNVVEGTDPSITLTINGTAEEYHKNISHHISITVPSITSHIYVTCSVANSISNRSAFKMLDACTELCYSCLQKSIMGGSVFLIVMSPFYIFAYWYTLRNMRKDAGNLIN